MAIVAEDCTENMMKQKEDCLQEVAPSEEHTIALEQLFKVIDDQIQEERDEESNSKLDDNNDLNDRVAIILTEESPEKTNKLALDDGRSSMTPMMHAPAATPRDNEYV